MIHQKRGSYFKLKIMKSLIILFISALILSSCGFKEYKPFDNAINVGLAKESTIKLNKEVNNSSKSKMASLR